MRFLLLLLLALAGLAAWAQPTAGGQPSTDLTKYNYLIGNSDAIVTATATAVKLPELPKAMPDQYGFNMRLFTGSVTWQVTKTLLGKVDGDALKMDVSLYPDWQIENGKSTVKGWRPALVEGQAYVVGLMKMPTGWRVNGQVMPGAEAVAVADAIAKFPVKVTLTAPAANPVLDSEVKWTVKVKNIGAQPVELRMCYVSGFVVQKLADLVVSTQSLDDGTVLAAEGGAAKFRTVAPNEEATLTVTTKVNGPAGWQLFDKKYFPLPTMMSVMVQFNFGDAGAKNPQTRFQRFMAKSAPVPVTFTAPAP
jgi:hypothetical protein